MSMNVNQVYIANPSTALPGTALFYAGLSPFGAGNDTAILVSNFLLQVPGATINTISGASQNLAPNQNYIANRGTLITFALPTVAAVGTIIEIIGQGAGGWIISQGAGQQIIAGSSATTSGATGTLASTNRYDTIRLMCVGANAIFQVLSGVTTGYTIV